MDGGDAGFCPRKTKAISTIDRRFYRFDRDGIALSSISCDKFEVARSKCRLDCAANCGMGWRLIVAPEYVGCETICLVPDWYRALDHDRRGSSYRARRHRTAEYHLQVLSTGLVPARRKWRRCFRLDNPRVFQMASGLAHLLADRHDSVDLRRGAVHGEWYLG